MAVGESHIPWLAIRKPMPPRRGLALKVAAFLLPLAVWCVVSYVPFVWHPMVRVSDGGGSTFLRKEMLVDRGVYEKEAAVVVAAGKAAPAGERANPIFLPAPHEVGRAFYTAFTTPPVRRGEPWLHESLWHSVQIIFWGFAASAVLGVPLGILCGTFDALSKLCEPFVDFVRYMPAPVFGALAVAILGIDDGPKVAIIFIGTFFQMVLVVANTTRLLEPALLEAAQTLGATKRRLVTHVILPGILPNLYRDMRILIGWAWTYLIVAELIGASSGISYFINQQGKYRHYENVYAGIVMIGLIGIVTDQALALLGDALFPWQSRTGGAPVKALWAAVTWVPRQAVGVLTRISMSNLPRVSPEVELAALQGAPGALRTRAAVAEAPAARPPGNTSNAEPDFDGPLPRLGVHDG